MEEKNNNVSVVQNYAIVLVMSNNEVIHTYHITPDLFVFYAPLIESAFINNTGGWTIRFQMNI